MPASDPDLAVAPNRSRWMRQGRACMAACDWAGAIRAYGQGLMEQPLLGMHYAAPTWSGPQPLPPRTPGHQPPGPSPQPGGGGCS